ncbi:MAG: HDOD domain-containing protein [Comamonadaceae bacterium]|nr:HDOD domain-containing protein [Comamonadaceae bacterium]
MRRAARLQHPNLAPRGRGRRAGRLALRRLRRPATPRRWPSASAPQGAAGAASRAAVFVQVLAGLAFAHEGGVAHHDLQAFVLLARRRWPAARDGPRGGAAEVADARSTARQPRRRCAAQRDAGAARRARRSACVLHQALCRPARARTSPTSARVIERLPPLGREIVRLPWTTAQPVPEPLRAIVNRATDRQERQRYRSARTLARALEGWLADRSRRRRRPAGACCSTGCARPACCRRCPAPPQRAARLALMERERTDELAEVVLQDLALAFELLRAVNTAQVRGAQVAGSGPVLTVRRAIAMLGPGRRAPRGAGAAALARSAGRGAARPTCSSLIDRVQARRPHGRRRCARPATTPRWCTLLALLQNLGRLVMQYHFPDEAQQIRRLMQPRRRRAGEPEEPGHERAGRLVRRARRRHRGASAQRGRAPLGAGRQRCCT